MRHWILSVGLMCVFVFPLSAQESPTRKLDAAFPEVPQEVLHRYVSTVMTSPLYQVAQGLPEEELRTRAQAWSEALGLEIQVETAPLLDELQARTRWGPGHRVDRASGPSAYRGLWRRAGLLLLHDLGGAGPDLACDRPDQIGLSDDEEISFYRVRADQIPGLRFQTLRQIRILHPASTPLEEEVLEDMDLPSAVKTICEANGLGYAFRSDGLESIRVSLKTQGRSARRILQILDSIAGPGCHVHVDDLSEEGFDGVITISNLEEEFARRRYLGAGDDPNVSPIKVLEELVLREGKDVAARRPVAVFQTTAERDH